MITAIGLVIFIVCFVVAQSAVNYAKANFIKEVGDVFYFAVIGYIIGLVLMLIGVSIWLWRHMP